MDEAESRVAAEERFLADIAGDAAWDVVEYFATLHRESGSEDERKAADYIVERLRAAGVPVEVHRPQLYLSLPRKAEVRLGDSEGTVLHAKTPAFSASTGSEGVTGRVVYLPSRYAQGSGDLFGSSLGSANGRDLEGAIALTEGLPLPQQVGDLLQRGAAAAVFVNPGERIHEAICTPIWGGPDLDNEHMRPDIPVAAINRADGEAFIEAVKAADAAGKPFFALVETNLEEGLYECPVTVATIPGPEDVEEFVLLHGHLDSWHAGVGDNAVGDGALLELALALWRHRSGLRRSVRVAWWPGHSHGRYAGSTWYADAFGVDLAEHCVAQVNCDSPGCAGAELLADLCWTPELEAFTRQVVRDVADQEARGGRPPRAGDYSFNNLGVSGAFMLSSTLPESVRKERNYYGVGGCGGNIEWHTEADTLDVADRDILLRDTKVYGAAVWRLAAEPVVPLRPRDAVLDIKKAARSYAERAGSDFDLSPVLEECDRLDEALAAWELERDGLAPSAVNEALLRVSRLLNRIHFAREGAFRQDPALPVPPLPDLSVVDELARSERGSVERQFVLNSLVRGRNRVVFALREAQRVVERARG